MFLERYLDDPIEPLIGAAADRPVERGGIVEVGNLAAIDTAHKSFTSPAVMSKTGHRAVHSLRQVNILRCTDSGHD